MTSNDEKHWHALYVKSRSEKKVAARLEEQGIEVFLPLATIIKQWSDRKKRVEEPLFKSYLFVHSTPKQHLPILNVYGVLRFVSFEHQPVIVPENQIRAIKNYIEEYEENKSTLETVELKEGQLVRIISGPLTGIEGRLVSTKDMRRLIVYIEAVGQYLPIRIARTKVEPIIDSSSNNEHKQSLT